MRALHLILILPFFVQAQYRSGGCVDPGKKLQLHNIRFHSVKMILGDSAELQHFYKDRSDSVQITKNGKTLAAFKTQNHYHISGSYRQYDAAGALRLLDSVHPSRPGAIRAHYYSYTAEQIQLRKTFYPGGAPESILYYGIYGTDSLERRWHENGMIHSLKRFVRDTLPNKNLYAVRSPRLIELLEYNENGALAKRTVPSRNFEAHYNATGIPERISFDTTLTGKELSCVKKFWNDGILQSISYFQDTVPCGTWFEYNRAGGLSRTIKKSAPRKLSSVVAEPPEDDVYYFVEERASYPGDKTALKAYLEKELNYMHFKYPASPQGTYKLRFEVTQNGKVLFAGLEGDQAEIMSGDLRHLVESMPAWRPGKRQGRPLSEFYELVLSPL